jgi:hypothetical protein
VNRRDFVERLHDHLWIPIQAAVDALSLTKGEKQALRSLAGCADKTEDDMPSSGLYVRLNSVQLVIKSRRSPRLFRGDIHYQKGAKHGRDTVHPRG